MSPTRVLIVEDHQMTRMGLSLLLGQNNDYTLVGEADTGVSAVEQANTQYPDVILMDIGLPEMDGIEATQKIKEAHPTTRVLMLTSKDNPDDVFAALGAGADGYCMKGVSPESLFSAMQAVNEGAAWLDPQIAKLVLQQFAGGKPPQIGTDDKPAGPPPDCPLTPREMEVLKLIVDGHSNPKIAEALVITKATAKAHVHSILQKLCVDDRTQAAVLAMRQGLV